TFDELPAHERGWDVNIGSPAHEALRHDADHRADRIVQRRPPSKYVAVAAELALPETVTEYHNRLCAGSGIVGRRRSADERRDAHDLKCIEGAVVSTEPLGIAVTGPQHVGDRGRDDAVEYGAALGDFQE